MIPNASDLTYFVEVSGTLNLSRAAERLGISQPSLTLAIQRLENSVGTNLLTRNKKGVMLTQAGKQLLAHSKHLLQLWDQVRAQAQASVNEVQGTYTIGSHISVALYSFSKFIPQLLERHPQLNIKFKHDLSRKIAEGIIVSNIDLGIVVNPIKHPDLVIFKLWDDEVTLWTSGSRSNARVLICDPDLNQTQSLLKQVRKAGLEVEKIIETSSLEVITDLTMNGCGIGILPARVAGLSRKKLHRIPQAPVIHDEICLLFRVENRNVKAIQTICEAIKLSFKGDDPV